ncbi:hypothetical protein DPMN_058888 [Dreissena polymorpha]|uniref:Uncharacterized protein n=1 Tax=Dreissena polymorpha TaxID=45954 RepID=A0A9D4C2W7_DREPO|nr:hypothetical protein DPMN_058888 [Dreissena polymorpha]
MERASLPRDDGTRWFRRAANRSSPMQPFSDAEVKTYIHPRNITIRLDDSSEKSSRRYSADDSLAPVAMCTLRMLTEKRLIQFSQMCQSMSQF